MPIMLYSFRFKDPVSGKWVTARYRATREEIAARYAEHEIVGEPEVREVRPDAGFQPYREPSKRKP